MPKTATAPQQDGESALMTFTLDGLWESDWPGVIRKKVGGKKVRLAHLPALCLGLGIEFAGQVERWQSTPVLQPYLKFIRGVPFVRTEVVPFWLSAVTLDEAQPWQRDNLRALKAQIERDLQQQAAPTSAIASRIPMIAALPARVRSK